LVLIAATLVFAVRAVLSGLCPQMPPPVPSALAALAHDMVLCTAKGAVAPAPAPADERWPQSPGGDPDRCLLCALACGACLSAESPAERAVASGEAARSDLPWRTALRREAFPRGAFLSRGPPARTRLPA
jgi:hypothetical protein